MNDIAVIHDTHGREGESQSLARALVEEHFDDAPPGAVEALVNSTVLLAKLLREGGERDEALALYERLLERYGQPGVPDYRVTAAAANFGVARTVWLGGRLEESLQRFDDLIGELDDPSDPNLQQVLSGALLGKANVLSDMNLPQERNAVCEELWLASEAPKIRKLPRTSRGRRWCWMTSPRAGRADVSDGGA